MLAVSPLLRELILAACAEPLEWDEAGRGGHLAALILDEIARAQPLPLGVPAPRDPRLLRLAAALRAEPARPLSLEGWAAECGASPRTLTRLFRRETGMSFGRWRQMLRLSEAAALLAQGVPAARAAALVGYASVPAFGSAFRAAFGQTPGAAHRRASPHRRRAADRAACGESVKAKITRDPRLRCTEINNLPKSRQQYACEQRLHHMCVLDKASLQVMHGTPPRARAPGRFVNTCDLKHWNIAFWDWWSSRRCSGSTSSRSRCSETPRWCSLAGLPSRPLLVASAGAWVAFARARAAARSRPSEHLTHRSPAPALKARIPRRAATAAADSGLPCAKSVPATADQPPGQPLRTQPSFAPWRRNQAISRASVASTPSTCRGQRRRSHSML